MINFTLDDLVNFTLNEKKMVNEVLASSSKEQDMEPGEDAIRNVLNYSKSLSVRKSDKLGKLYFVLN